MRENTVGALGIEAKGLGRAILGFFCISAGSLNGTKYVPLF
jgi:hypothetical protein